MAELLEDAFARLGRNAGAGVVDDEGQTRPGAAAADPLDGDADGALSVNLTALPARLNST
jgi:hypothetical protein